MTSRNSFWANSKENHRRRIWVWIVSIMVQLMSYVGMLTVYLSRIRLSYSDGAYRTYEEYISALCQGTKDALAFQDNLAVVLGGLSVMIGMHGFSYLYDKRKVDMYHSVPVNKNKRFAVVYVNGLIIYLTSTLVSILLGVIVAWLQHAMDAEVLAVVGLGFLWNLLFFLVIYHTVILAVMVTGNRFITLCVAGGLVVYESGAYFLVNAMQYAFFETVSGFYVTHNPKLSVFNDYFSNIWQLKMAEDVQSTARIVLPYCGKWFILALVILAVAWVCYGRRPSEAAGKAIAFSKLEPVFKVIAVIPIGIGLGMWVHSAAYGSMALTAVSMIGSGVIACGFIEVIYDFDIKSLFKHLVSSGVAVAAIAVIFLAFKFDLTGYDKYIPDVDELDSIALSVDYYGQFWDENFQYVGNAEFSEEHMFLKDVEPVLALAAKSQKEQAEDMDDCRIVNVLYRLKSGRRVGRRFNVDFSNPANEELMNRIVGTREYKEGTYQIMTDEASYAQALGITYNNGATNLAIPVEDALKLREAYLKDMEELDFSLITGKRPCGQIKVKLPIWVNDSLDVYDSFENTIAYLQSKEAFYPVELNPEDIADITVTNYHNELNEVISGDVSETGMAYVDTREAMAVNADYSYSDEHIVTKTFLEEEEFAQITKVIYPAYMSSDWNDHRELDDNYDIYITFKKDTSYPYDRSNFGVYYKFYTGQAPAFVVEGTALGADGQ